MCVYDPLTEFNSNVNFTKIRVTPLGLFIIDLILNNIILEISKSFKTGTIIICQHRYCSFPIMNHVQKQKTCNNLLKSDFTDETLIIQIINQ